MPYDPDTRYGAPGCAVGRVLHTILRETGWTRAEFQRRTQSTASDVTRYCTGARTPDPETIQKWTAIRAIAPHIPALEAARREDRLQRGAAVEAKREARSAAPAPPTPDRSAPTVPAEQHVVEAALAAHRAMRTDFERTCLLSLLSAVATHPPHIADLHRELVHLIRDLTESRGTPLPTSRSTPGGHRAG